MGSEKLSYRRYLRRLTGVTIYFDDYVHKKSQTLKIFSTLFHFCNADRFIDK